MGNEGSVWFVYVCVVCACICCMCVCFVCVVYVCVVCVLCMCVLCVCMCVVRACTYMYMCMCASFVCVCWMRIVCVCYFLCGYYGYITGGGATCSPLTTLFHSNQCQKVSYSFCKVSYFESLREVHNNLTLSVLKSRNRIGWRLANTLMHFPKALSTIWAVLSGHLSTIWCHFQHHIVSFSAPPGVIFSTTGSFHPNLNQVLTLMCQIQLPFYVYVPHNTYIINMHNLYLWFIRNK